MRIKVNLLSRLGIEVWNALDINIKQSDHVVHISLREEVREQKQDYIHSKTVLSENRSSFIEILSIHK